MSITFTKLFSSITESTIWCEDSDIRVVWITMLAMSDKNGRIWASIPGLAKRAAVSIEQTETALNKFLSPDPYSRTKEHEGRRIEVIDGGWRLLNHAKYRAIRDDEERKAYKRDWIKNKREEEKQQNVDNVDRSRPQYTHTDTEAEAYTDTKDQKIGDNSPPDCKQSATPYQKIVEIYHETLTELPRVAKLTKTRKGYIQQRWKEDLPDLKNWQNFFEYVAQSEFLTGKVNGSGDRPPFRADFEWLIKPSNFVKIAEGKYHV